MQDVRFAGRLLVKQRGFTLGVVLVLGDRHGADLRHGTPLRTPSCSRGSPVTTTGASSPSARVTRWGQSAGVSLLDFEDWRDANETFDGIAAMFPIGLNVSDDENAAEFVFGAYISHDAFGLLRNRASCSAATSCRRTIVDGAPGTAILSHRLWMSRYGGDPEVIGRTIRLNDRPSVLIGVMPEGIRVSPFDRDSGHRLGPQFGGSAARNANARTHQAFGRLADAVSLARARADLDVVGRPASPTEYPDTNAGIRPTAVPFTEPLADDWVTRLLFSTAGGAVDLRAPDCVRERGQSAAVALGAPGARDEPPPVARGNPLAARSAVAGRDPPADGGLPVSPASRRPASPCGW